MKRANVRIRRGAAAQPRPGRLRPTAIGLAATTAAIFACGAQAADATHDEFLVDAAIVLAVDSSFSIDPKAADLQRLGHAAALRSNEVIDAISKGATGCIAVTYFEWAGSGELRSVLPWTRICGTEDATPAAEVIARNGDVGYRRTWSGRTSLSFAIGAASLLLDSFPGETSSKIIDVSTNGTNNDGLSVAEIRRRTVAKGQTINAIAVSREEPGITADLRGYLAENVIGGPNAFALGVERQEDYARLLRRKLVLEISSANRSGTPAASANEASATDLL